MLRPRIAISACLLGHGVRYDGGHKTDSWILQTLGPRVDWIPLCPEVEAGLGVPREPIDLHRDAASTRLLGRKTGLDFAESLQAATRRLLTQIANADGHILKARSPSCGRGDAPVFSGGQQVADGDGIYAEALQMRFPELPVITEVELQDTRLRAAFMERVRSRLWNRGGRAFEGELE